MDTKIYDLVNIPFIITDRDGSACFKVSSIEEDGNVHYSYHDLKTNELHENRKLMAGLFNDYLKEFWHAFEILDTDIGEIN